MPYLALLLCLLFTPLVWADGSSEPAASASAPVTVYVARRIITMEPAMPSATAVAVADGRIVGVGDLDSLDRWLEVRGGEIDRTFENKVLMPGFVDPHVHPSLPAVVTQFPFLAPDDWSLPTGEFPGARTPEDYKRLLTEQVDRWQRGEGREEAIPFISWGYHPLWHGEVYRAQLNDWFPDAPVLLWHRSFHELFGNDAAFELLGVTEEDFAGHHETDWARGTSGKTAPWRCCPRWAS